MRNGDGGGKFPPGPFSSSDSPDALGGPVAGAFIEGATTVMNDEQRRQALAAAGIPVDPPKAAKPKPAALHDEPTRDPTLPAPSASFDFGVDASSEAPPPAADPVMATAPPVDAGFNEPIGQAAAPSAGDGFDEPAMGADPGLPSHLQLPSIDFSLPDGMSGGTPPGGFSSEPGAELPAHLQLPNFPEFDLPSVPGMEAPRSAITEDVGIEGNLGGSFGAMSDAPGPANQTGADDWAVAPASQAAVPPPPPKRAPKRQQQQAQSFDMPGLPQINLPSVAQPQSKKEPTLLRADVAEKLATQKKKSLAVPIISVVVLIIAAGTTLFVYKDAIIERFFPAHQREAVETNTDKARKLVALGTSFYDSNQMPNALAAFEQALGVDPTYAKAHRSLGIAYAKMNQPDKAVTHYRTYLLLAPTADDADAVRKIVADYDLKAKEQAAADKAKAEEERKAAAEERKKKRR